MRNWSPGAHPARFRHHERARARARAPNHPPTHANRFLIEGLSLLTAHGLIFVTIILNQISQVSARGGAARRAKAIRSGLNGG